jgi:Kef-type K+ transport system membrane component KefB
MDLTLITLGALFAIGLVADELGRRTRLPRVTLLVLLGVLIGPAGFDLLPDATRDWYNMVAAIALTMVAFLLGGALSLTQLKSNGREILLISIAVVLVTLVMVFGGLVLIGVAPVLAILLAGIATATDPAATEEVIRQTRAEGSFAETLKGIVAIDDAWGLIAFSLILAFASFLIGNGASEALASGARDLLGAVGVGALVGFPAAYLTGRLREGEPMQAEALAVVFMCAGLALWLDVSYLLAGIVAGAIIVNTAPHHTRAFHEIEHFEWPFMLIFFLLAGSRIYTEHWLDYAPLVVAFIVLRTLARLIGGWIGGHLAGSGKGVKAWIGAALLPQAGVAVGMALVAGHHFPEHQDVILNIAIITTVFFEVLGPVASKMALSRNALARNTQAIIVKGGEKRE